MALEHHERASVVFSCFDRQHASATGERCARPLGQCLSSRRSDSSREAARPLSQAPRMPIRLTLFCARRPCAAQTDCERLASKLARTHSKCCALAVALPVGPSRSRLRGQCARARRPPLEAAGPTLGLLLLLERRLERVLQPAARTLRAYLCLLIAICQPNRRHSRASPTRRLRAANSTQKQVSPFKSSAVDDVPAPAQFVSTSSRLSCRGGGGGSQSTSSRGGSRSRSSPPPTVSLAGRPGLPGGRLASGRADRPEIDTLAISLFARSPAWLLADGRWRRRSSCFSDCQTATTFAAVRLKRRLKTQTPTENSNSNDDDDDDQRGARSGGAEIARALREIGFRLFCASSALFCASLALGWSSLLSLCCFVQLVGVQKLERGREFGRWPRNRAKAGKVH